MTKIFRNENKGVTVCLKSVNAREIYDALGKLNKSIAKILDKPFHQVRGKAVCSEENEYDTEIGEKLARSRARQNELVFILKRCRKLSNEFACASTYFSYLTNQQTQKIIKEAIFQEELIKSLEEIEDWFVDDDSEGNDEDEAE